MDILSVDLVARNPNMARTFSDYLRIINYFLPLFLADYDMDGLVFFPVRPILVANLIDPEEMLFSIPPFLSFIVVRLEV